MATCDNKIWLLKLIRDAFIITDDTGLCEIVMAGEDYTKFFANKAVDERERLRSERLCQPSTSKGWDGIGNISEVEPEPVTQFDPYPQAEDSEDDDLAGSYIRYDDILGHRQRSNTAQWLDKKEQALLKAAKIKVIKWDDSTTQLTDEQMAEAFKKIDIKKGVKQKSLLSEQMENCPELPHRQYLEYAKFDSTAQTGLQSKMFKIFLTTLPENARNYPIVICIIASARIKDLIGLSCYKFSIEYPEMSLGEIDDYGLCIAEDDGEVDTAFPCLDAYEPCSKYGFTCLGLVELKSISSQAHTTCSLPDDSMRFDGFSSFGMFPKDPESAQSNQNSRHNTGGSATSEAVKSALEAVSSGIYKKTENDLNKIHKLAAEAPQYKVYRVHMLRKLRANTLVHLGISLERVEVEPLTASKLVLWWKAKFFRHNIDTIAWCQMLEAKGCKCIFRIGYNADQCVYDRNASYFFSPNTNYKFHDFEADHATAKEIVDKVNTILELRNSPCRREYKSAKEKKLQTRRSFHTRHMMSS